MLPTEFFFLRWIFFPIEYTHAAVGARPRGSNSRYFVTCMWASEFLFYFVLPVGGIFN